MRITSKPLATAATGATMAGLVAAGALVGSGVGSADPVKLELGYSCEFPMIGAQPLKVAIEADAPKEAKVGSPTDPFDIKAVATVAKGATEGLNLVGAKTVEGKAFADTRVEAPQFPEPLDVAIPTTIEKTEVPAEGELQTNATGMAPGVKFTKAGKAKITLGGLKLRLTPQDANGQETQLGTFDAPCKLDEGQNTTLTEVEIKE